MSGYGNFSYKAAGIYVAHLPLQVPKNSNPCTLLAGRALQEKICRRRAKVMTGIHKRVGDVRKQDKVLTVEVVKSIQRILEGEWTQVKDDLPGLATK
jgi:hypothetical protein